MLSTVRLSADQPTPKLKLFPELRLSPTKLNVGTR
jgi:hypothetical protein